MKRFLPLIFAILVADAQAAPEIGEPRVVQPGRQPAGENVIDDHRFAISLDKRVMGNEPIRLLWSIEEQPPGSKVVVLPVPEVLNNPDNKRSTIGLEVNRAGRYTIGVTATDRDGSAKKSATVDVRNPLVLLTEALPRATVGEPYAFRFLAQGGCSPYHFSLSGRLSEGLRFTGDGIEGKATTPATAELELTVTDALGKELSRPLRFVADGEPIPWGMLNIGSSFTPPDHPLEAAAEQLGWDRHGWKRARGGTLGVGVGYTWNSHLPMRWQMLDRLRSGRYGSLFLHQGTPWLETLSLPNCPTP